MKYHRTPTWFSIFRENDNIFCTKPRATLTQRAEKTLDVGCQTHFLAPRRVPVLGDNGLVNRQQVGGHDRPLSILRRQRLESRKNREGPRF
jgi:hypothetical protein